MINIRRSGWFVIAAAFSTLAVSGELAAQDAKAYVPTAANGTVAAIDLERGNVAWTIRIGERAAHGIASSPDGNIVYAGDPKTQEVVVIDAIRRTVLKRIPVELPVHGIDIAPDGKTLWAGGQAGNDPIRGTLAVINTETLLVEDMISPMLGAASHFAFTPDGREAWIASTSTNLVWIVDVATRKVVASIPLSLPASQQRPAPGDNWGSYLAERKLIGLNEVAIAPGRKRAYAVGPAVSELFAIDVETRQVVGSVNAGERAHGVTVSPDGEQVWISDWAGAVNVFDAATLAPLFQISVAKPGMPAGPAANHVAFDPERRRVYVTGVDDVIVIDPDEKRIVGRIPVGMEPHEISLEDWIAPALRRPSRSSKAPDEVTVAENSASATPKEPADMTRVSDERSVLVQVTPLNLSAAADVLEFRIVLETHAVELDYDLTRLVTLSDGKGNEYRPMAWDGATGGHHVNGVLKFAEGKSIMDGAQYLQLRMDGIAGGPPRLFRWDSSEYR